LDGWWRVLFHVEHFWKLEPNWEMFPWNKAEFRPDRAWAHNGKASNTRKFLTQNHGSFPPLEAFSVPEKLSGEF